MSKWIKKAYPYDLKPPEQLPSTVAPGLQQICPRCSYPLDIMGFCARCKETYDMKIKF